LTERFGVVENRALELVEGVARPVVSDLEQLLIADPLISADGRADVQSEDTTDEGRDLDAGQGLERFGYARCAGKGELESANGAQGPEAMGVDSHRIRDHAQLSLCTLECRFGQKSRSFVADAFDSGH
jgi:hypothetical protein